jgi:Ca2+-binding RTX toxin-like protein
MVISKAVGRSLAACAITIPTALGVGVPAAHAKNGDTHITGQGIVQTLDCNESTLYVMGTGNTINALGSCWAVTVQGSSNVVVADNVVDNIIVYGNDQTVFYKNGDPTVWDRGRELGMTNRIDRVPA